MFFLFNCFLNFRKLIYKVKFPAFFSDKKVCYNKKYKSTAFIWVLVNSKVVEF
ncbi:hypothetical protein LM500065_160013 [Listeria monocytogenes]|nr:hypothetical protein LM500065_160013 [Listeria monocytogenes]CUL63332.1 hypothetical protein LM800235_80013 [Listeria monocytogenes]